MRRMVIAVALAAAGLARAAPLETKDDRLCRAIGESPKMAVQPRDRIFFEDRCACVERLGCASARGTRIVWLRQVGTCLDEIDRWHHELSEIRVDNAESLCFGQPNQKKLIARLQAEYRKIEAARAAQEQRERSEAEAKAKALEQERSGKLPKLQVEARAVCKEFRACMRDVSASCWDEGGPGRRYEAICKEYSRLDGSVPWRCENKSSDECDW